MEKNKITGVYQQGERTINWTPVKPISRTRTKDSCVVCVIVVCMVGESDGPLGSTLSIKSLYIIILSALESG